MGTHVALLRGINVGKNKRVAMADLRHVIESLGYTNARTLLNSGNAVFESPRALRKGAAEELRMALEKKTSVSSRFILRSATELAATMKANPLVKQAADPTRLFVLFLADRSVAQKAQPLMQQAWKPEVVASGPDAFYIWCPNGLLESKAMAAFGKALGDGVTVRNWATVEKLGRMAIDD
jgi:uncharacterized protein (DUF1697 family)